MFEIGNSLREVRLRRRIDLVEAEQDTKIRSKYLAALEREEFDVLPGVVYVRGFLRTYARYLGLDPQVYIDEYNDRFGRFEDIEELIASTRPGSIAPRRQRFTMRRVAVVCLVLLAALTWLGLQDGSQGASEQSDVTVVAALGPGAAFDMAQDAVRKGAIEQRAQERKAEVAQAAQRRRLTLRARGGDSWIAVRRAGPDGPVTFAGTMASGATKTFSGKRLYVTVGMPSVVQLRTASGLRKLVGAATQNWVFANGRLTRVD